MPVLAVIEGERALCQPPDKQLQRTLRDEVPRRIRRVLLCLALLSGAGAIAAAYAPGPHIVARLGQVEVDIPPGFVGPQRVYPNPQSELDIYAQNVGDGR